MCIRDRGWRCGDCTRLSPMWSRFDSRTRCHKWVEFVFVLFSVSRVFFRALRFSSLSKNQHAADSIWVWCCAPRSHMDRIAAARGAFVCFRFDLVELRRCCTFQRRLAVTVYSFDSFYFALCLIYLLSCVSWQNTILWPSSVMWAHPPCVAIMFVTCLKMEGKSNKSCFICSIKLSCLMDF